MHRFRGLSELVTRRASQMHRDEERPPWASIGLVAAPWRQHARTNKECRDVGWQKLVDTFADKKRSKTLDLPRSWQAIEIGMRSDQSQESDV